MKHKRLLASMTVAALLAGGRFALGDDHDHENYRAGKSARVGVAPVTDPLYRQECGSCHMPYQPGLLPARSWIRVMAGLDNHFGENAELSGADRDRLLQYLVQHAADHAAYERSARIRSSLGPGEAPLRISETPYIARKHRELPARAVGPTAQVKSLSQCQACHRGAERGTYNEHDVVIPGIGRWDD